MIRKIIIPTERQYILEIPASFIGKNVEVLAFEVAEAEGDDSPQVESSFSERTKDLRYHSGGYKFNREEANDYE